MGKTLLRVHAPAKINLSLRILGAAAGGYHDLRTVFQAIDLHDTIAFEHAPGPLSVACTDASISCDNTNLAWRAAEAITRAAGHAGAPRDIRIKIVKRIPAQAGLGGGSSDAAAVLRALTRLWRLQIPLERMRAIAATLGADVPFFLEGGTALGLGKGDLLFALADQPPAWVTVVMHRFGVSTKDAYAWYDETRGRRPPSATSVVSGFSRTLPETGNDLQAPVVERHPEIDRTLADLVGAGAIYALMSGSGSAVFGLFPTRRDAARAARTAASGRGRRAVVTRYLNRVQYQALAGV